MKFHSKRMQYVVMPAISVCMYTSCVDMKESRYCQLQLKSSDVMWVCPKSSCVIPNYSSVLTNSPLIECTDNRFSVLATASQSCENYTNPTDIAHLVIVTHQKTFPAQLHYRIHLSSNGASLGHAPATPSPSTKDPRVYTH